MAKYIFPAIFHPEEEGGFSIAFPDIEGCYTQGETVAEGMEMAGDVLPLMLTAYEDSMKEIPAPTAINDLVIAEGDFATLISCDTSVYRQLMNNLTVKKTLSIPQWLNQAAIAAGVNFSQVFQDALKEIVGTEKAKPQQ